VNDDKTLRAYGSRTDAYATFKGMLEDGNPPDTFDALLKEAAAAQKRFEKTLEAAPDR
jgi:toxin YhaV